ncbi:MAG: ATP-binding cassette domain-containing protein [Desulfuromonadaceae bacterium]|nr:ATP-binding cassette domain-containing protein [Desulfuromonadaceae bacterium]
MQLSFKNLTKSYGPRRVLDDISIDLPDAHAIAVIGPSGGGKTTLLRTIAGLERPDCGQLSIDGELLRFDDTSLLLHRRSIGTVFQAFNLFPHLTALENILLPLEQAHGYRHPEAVEAAESILKRFQLEGHADKKPAQLSGGQQQRIAIARAIAIKPRFLLLDEPTSALDPEMTAEVLDIIGELQDEGRDLLLVTHHMGFARTAADYCLFVADGRIVENGPADRLFAEPKSKELQQFLGRVMRY